MTHHIHHAVAVKVAVTVALLAAAVLARQPSEPGHILKARPITIQAR